MIPILYPETETAFSSNGIGFLSDTIKARVPQTLNGTFELEVTYPLTGIHADQITDRCFILAKPDPVSDPQPFRIYRINPASKGTMKVYARHLAYDLMGIPAAPFTAASAADAMAQLKASAAVACPFSFFTDKAVSSTLSNPTPKSIWKLLGGSSGSVLDVYGGEYEFDRYNVRLLTRRGADRGVSIRYGKNLKTLEQDRNCSNVYTGVYPYWVSSEGELVQLTEKVLYAEGTYSFVRMMELDLSDRFETDPTEAQLRARAQKYMTDNAIGVPDVSWKVEFVQLEQTEEYKDTAILERVLMGDTVTAIFPDMNVNASARVVETDFDPILERYNSVTLGKVKASLADTIVKQQQELDKKPDVETITGIIGGKLGAIFGTRGGAVRLLDTDGDGQLDELYIADNPDPAQAIQVWRFNYEGWATSKTGYNGPFVMGATLEDGLLAEFVTAAKLVAGTIQSADGDTFFLDLDEGVLHIKSANVTVDDKAMVTQTDLSMFRTEASNITLSVQKVTEKLDSSMAGVNGDIEKLTKRVDATITAEEAKLEIKSQLKNVSSVTTTTGFTFNELGMTVDKSSSDVATTVTENGLRVYEKRTDETKLKADKDGVDAENLHATTYLIVGKNSRFEDYGSGRTGCFWIGD